MHAQVSHACWIRLLSPRAAYWSCPDKSKLHCCECMTVHFFEHMTVQKVVLVTCMLAERSASSFAAISEQVLSCLQGFSQLRLWPCALEVHGSL